MMRIFGVGDDAGFTTAISAHENHRDFGDSRMPWDGNCRSEVTKRFHSCGIVAVATPVPRVTPRELPAAHAFDYLPVVAMVNVWKTKTHPDRHRKNSGSPIPPARCHLSCFWKMFRVASFPGPGDRRLPSA
jgi:hypothetical protein